MKSLKQQRVVCSVFLILSVFDVLFLFGKQDVLRLGTWKSEISSKQLSGLHRIIQAIPSKMNYGKLPLAEIAKE